MDELKKRENDDVLEIEKSIQTESDEVSSSQKSFDEQLFEDSINKDPFQIELDKAIEERRLAEFLDEHSIKLYEYDREHIETEIEVNGVTYKHRTKNPTKDDETRKELMSVTIKKNAGKVDGDTAVTAVNENGNALRRYYDGIAFEIWGYPVDEDDNAEQWITVAQVVEPAETVSEEDRRRFAIGEKKDLTVLHLIPEADKLKVAQLIHAGQCVVLKDKKKRIRSLRARREYIVKQLFGVKAEDDGTLSKPTHVASYHFNEAGAKAISKFQCYAIQPKTVFKDGGNEEQRTINIPATDGLFDAHIQCIQGASIDGVEVLTISQGDARLAKVPSACKRDATIIFFQFLTN